MGDFEYRGLRVGEMEYEYETQMIRCKVVVYDELGEECLAASAPCTIEAAVIDVVDAYCTRHNLVQPKTHAQWMHEHGFSGRFYEGGCPKARRMAE